MKKASLSQMFLIIQEKVISGNTYILTRDAESYKATYFIDKGQNDYQLAPKSILETLKMNFETDAYAVVFADEEQYQPDDPFAILKRFADGEIFEGPRVFSPYLPEKGIIEQKAVSNVTGTSAEVYPSDYSFSQPALQPQPAGQGFNPPPYPGVNRAAENQNTAKSGWNVEETAQPNINSSIQMAELVKPAKPGWNFEELAQHMNVPPVHSALASPVATFETVVSFEEKEKVISGSYYEHLEYKFKLDGISRYLYFPYRVFLDEHCSLKSSFSSLQKQMYEIFDMAILRHFGTMKKFGFGFEEYEVQNQSKPLTIVLTNFSGKQQGAHLPKDKTVIYLNVKDFSKLDERKGNMLLFALRHELAHLTGSIYKIVEGSRIYTEFDEIRAERISMELQDILFQKTYNATTLHPIALRFLEMGGVDPKKIMEEKDGSEILSKVIDGVSKSFFAPKSLVKQALLQLDIQNVEGLYELYLFKALSLGGIKTLKSFDGLAASSFEWFARFQLGLPKETQAVLKRNFLLHAIREKLLETSDGRAFSYKKEKIHEKIIGNLLGTYSITLADIQAELKPIPSLAEIQSEFSASLTKKPEEIQAMLSVYSSDTLVMLLPMLDEKTKPLITRYLYVDMENSPVVLSDIIAPEDGVGTLRILNDLFRKNHPWSESKILSILKAHENDYFFIDALAKLPDNVISGLLSTIFANPTYRKYVKALDEFERQFKEIMAKKRASAGGGF